MQHEMIFLCRSLLPPCDAATQRSCMPVSGLQLKTGEISHCWAEEARRWRTSSGLGGPCLLATAADNGGLLCAEVPCMELPEIKSHQVGRLALLHSLFRIWPVYAFKDSAKWPAQPSGQLTSGRSSQHLNGAVRSHTS